MSELEQYEVRKKKVYDFICSDVYVPMKIKELAIMLAVTHEDRPQLERILLELQQEGKIVLSKRGKYTKGEEKRLTGTFTAHPKGFGFVTIPDESEDIFIPETKVNGAMHMDTVEVIVSPAATGRRREGAVVKIVERGMKQVVCTYEQSKTFGFGVPDNTKFAKDIFIPQERSKGAVSGHKVVVEITNYGANGKNPEGKVVEILGHINDPGVDILSIVRAYGLPVEFSEKIMHQVENVAHEVSSADMAGRKDLRDWQMVTIDGEDAKDLDDAVSLTMDGDNYVLGVHIADVTNYVQEHSALDVEALKRGTSVYLVDRVIPMLPHALSNGICSLNAGENRLALSCIMTINPKGEVIDHEIAETVICVDRRMSYTNVKKILADHDAATIAEYEELVPMFLRMETLSTILRKKRMKRGAIDFDFPETKVVLDEQGVPVAIKPYERNVATKIIEDFMLIANETVAQDYFWQDAPFLYRTHEKPDSEKIHKLSTFINNFGYSIHIGSDEVHPKELQKLLDNDREKYEKFFAAFGPQIKYGVLADYGAKKEALQDLLLYWSSKEGKLISLKEYAAAMPEDQKYIYYANGESRERLGQLPQMEKLQQNGYDVLFMTDEVDGFVPQTLGKYQDKELKSITAGDLGLETEEEKKAAEEKSEKSTTRSRTCG